MMVPLLHHGMLIKGLPYSLPALNQTRSGGTPYGVTHLQGSDDPAKLSEEEASLAVLLNPTGTDSAAPQFNHLDL